MITIIYNNNNNNKMIQNELQQTRGGVARGRLHDHSTDDTKPSLAKECSGTFLRPVC